MTHPSDLVELRERVRKATKRDPFIDGELEVLARRFEAYAVGINDTTRAKWRASGNAITDGHTSYYAEPFTASIDAALSLVERVLPGWQYTLYGGGEEDALCELLKDGHVKNDGEGKTLPLAILDAALTALSQLTGE